MHKSCCFYPCPPPLHTNVIPDSAAFSTESGISQAPYCCILSASMAGCMRQQPHVAICCAIDADDRDSNVKNVSCDQATGVSTVASRCIQLSCRQHCSLCVAPSYQALAATTGFNCCNPTAAYPQQLQCPFSQNRGINCYNLLGCFQTATMYAP